MNDKQRRILIEQATTAFRPRDADGAAQPHPAFRDLDAAGRIELHASIEMLRRFEAALDPQGLSTTARVVMARIRGG